MIHWCFAHPWIGLAIVAAFGVAQGVIKLRRERAHGG